MDYTVFIVGFLQVALFVVVGWLWAVQNRRIEEMKEKIGDLEHEIERKLEQKVNVNICSLVHSNTDRILNDIQGGQNKLFEKIDTLTNTMTGLASTLTAMAATVSSISEKALKQGGY